MVFYFNGVAIEFLLRIWVCKMCGGPNHWATSGGVAIYGYCRHMCSNLASCFKRPRCHPLSVGDYGFTRKLACTWFKFVDELPKNVGDQRYDSMYPYGFRQHPLRPLYPFGFRQQHPLRPHKTLSKLSFCSNLTLQSC